MMKVILYSLLLISMGLLTPSCGPPSEPSTTSMPITILTATPMPSPVPSPSPAELFSQRSQSWKVAFVDTSSHKVCAMYGDGSSTSCLDYIDYELPNGYRRKLGSWSPDGNRFVHDRNDDTGIFIWDLNGGVIAFQESGEGLVFRHPFWSTNGKYIAYQIEPVAQWNIPADVPGTYIETLDHSYKIRISPEEVSVDWSPDGQSLLFSDGDIYISMSDGASPHKLTHDKAGYIYPTWSPDGLLIAFLRLNGSHNGLYIMNADGSAIRKVADLDIRNSYAMFNYTWLPTGRYILYDDQLIDIETGTSSRLSFPFDPSSAVWFTKPKSNGIPLTQTPILNREDGRIAYTSCLSDDPNTCEIYSMNADGSESIRLTKNEVCDGSPDWSPDGLRIAFVSTIPDMGEEIFIMDDDGSNLQQLTDNWAMDTAPAWSPDGKKIAFVSHHHTLATKDRGYFPVSLAHGPGLPDSEIYIMNADGSNQIRLTDNLAAEKSPTWSPDGKKIVFISDQDGYDQFYAMNPDGSNMALLNSNGLQKWSVSLSPVGAQLVFAATNGIFVTDVDGGNLVQLIQSLNSSSPDWSPDGKQLVFALDFQIYIMNADGSGQINLTKNQNQNLSPKWGPAIETTFVE